MESFGISLLRYQQNLPFSIDEVFAASVDLQNAPPWHSVFTEVEQLTPDPIGLNSQWKVRFAAGSFTLQITSFRPPNQVVFEGTPIVGVTPNFTIEMEPAAGETLVHYAMHPDGPRLFQPLVTVFAPAYGRWDLDRYFRS